MRERVVEFGRARDGRIAKVVAGSLSLLTLGCAAWFALAPGAAPVAIGVIAAVLLAEAVMMLTDYSAVIRIDDDAVQIARLLWGSRTVPRSGVDAVVVARLVLPARGDGSARRILFLHGGAVVAAASPIRAFHVQELATSGLPVTVDDVPRTPRDLAHRHPGSVNRGERALAMLPLLAIVLGVGAAVIALIR